MNFTAKNLFALLVYIIIFQVVALIAWYFFDFVIFVPMIAGAVGSYVAGSMAKNKIQKL